MLSDVGVRRTVGKEGLLLEVELLREAHLGQHVKVVVQSGEIHLQISDEEGLSAAKCSARVENLHPRCCKRDCGQLALRFAPNA